MRNKDTLNLNIIMMLAVFTFVFLSCEYLFDNEIALFVSNDRTVLYQNYCLGISSIGFISFHFISHYLKDKFKKTVFIVSGIVSLICLFFICTADNYLYVLVSGLILFVLLGLMGSAAYYYSLKMMSSDEYIARYCGLGYGLGIFMQFILNNLVKINNVQGVVLGIFVLLLTALLIRNGNTAGSIHFIPDKISRAVFITLVLMVLLMTVMFSTLDNAMTLVHAQGVVDIGKWPRIILGISGIAAGCVFDLSKRKYMAIAMYCVMILSSISIVLLKYGGSFLISLIVFYLSAGFFAVFFTASFMELSLYMKYPDFFSGMGRMINNITAAVICGPVLILLGKENGIVHFVFALILFMLSSIVTFVYTFKRNNLYSLNERKDKLNVLAVTYSLNDRETEVFNFLVNTDFSNQEIADSLNISRRTLERHISAIYEKTGVKSRVGLLKLYNS
ncbi:MAG: LuxR C-terminal-related transcriptional regulator [Erysipelotrichaceae bacterium]